MNENIKHAIDAGTLLAGIAPRVMHLTGEDPSVTVPIALVDGEHGPQVIVLSDVLEALDARADGPRTRTGCTRLTEVDSFIATIKRWGSEHTVVYANTATLGFVAVLDDHPETAGATRWRQHRAEYACPRSPEWLAWTEIDGKGMKQAAFADFIESRLEDLAATAGMPLPLDLLQLARNLNIKTKGTFQREMNPTNGDSVLVCKTETTSDSTQIPRAFVIGIPVFEGGVRYQVEARIRFSISESNGPVFVVVLHRRKEIERDAFNEVRAKVTAETGRLILAGTP